MMEEGVENLSNPEQERLLNEQRDFLLEIAKNGGRVMTIGGVAVDVLLNGDLSRVHKDVDFLGFVENEKDIIEVFEKIGCHITQPPDNKYKIEVERGVIKAAVGLMQRSSDGPIMEWRIDDKQYSFQFNEPFEDTPSPVEGGDVRVISPEGLIQTLNINLALGIPMRPQDQESRRMIQEKFFPSEDPASARFVPAVKELVKD